jgi:hypothetical protein
VQEELLKTAHGRVGRQEVLNPALKECLKKGIL